MRKKAKTTIAWLRAKVILRNVKHGPRPTVSGGLAINGSRDAIRIGAYFNVISTSGSVQITVRDQGRLTIGDRVFLNQSAVILAAASVRIGDDCKIANLAEIRDTDTHEVSPTSGVRTEPVTLGRNVWIGRNAVVLPGVTIGDNAVIGAGAVVSKDIPANSVAVGVPARVVSTFEAPSSWARV